MPMVRCIALAPQSVESRAVKTLGSHLEDRYNEVGRIAKPIWLAIWLVCIALMTTPFRWWPFWPVAMFLLANLVVIARIECPRCEKRLGLIAQVQPRGKATARVAADLHTMPALPPRLG
jgi:hypothetical protein